MFAAIKTSGLGLWLYLCLCLGIPCKRNTVLTISAPNLNFEYNGTFEKSIRSTEKKIHILGEGLYWFYDNRSIVQNSIIYFLQITE